MKYLWILLMALFPYAGNRVAAQLQYNELPGFLKANSVWAFGEYGGYDFNTAAPVVTSIYASQQCASVSDSATGQLLFYAGAYQYIPVSAPNDTGRCFDRNHQIMTNGESIAGCNSGGSTAQGYSIVPVIDSPGKYYLFSLNWQGGQPGLYYSVVDMSLNGGLGDLVPDRKNIILDSSKLSEAMVVVPGNNCDVWLIVHAFQEPQFKAYRIHAGGIDTPVISVAGEIGLNPFRDYAWYSKCQMAVSPDRSKLVLTHNYTNLFNTGLTNTRRHTSGTHLFRFDPWTGTISDYVRVHSMGIGFGAAFSPDNSKLYVWTRNFGWSSSSDGTVRQYDVTSHDSATIVASAYDINPPLNGRNGLLTSLRLYNGKIYASVVGTAQVDVINQPNSSGVGCDYQRGAITMHPGQRAIYGLPSEVVYPYHDTFYYRAMDTLICVAWDNLELAAPEGYDTYVWNDGFTGHSRQVTDYGTWWVKSSGCHSRVDTFTIRGGNVVFDLGPDSVICNTPAPVLNPDKPGMQHRWQDGSTAERYIVNAATNLYWLEVSQDGCTHSDTVQIHFADLRQDFGYEDRKLCQRQEINLTLEANVPPGASAVWQDGSSASYFDVRDTGTYWVEVRDSFCVASDTLHVMREFCDCFIELPTAFSPNGDGRNDVWRPVVEPGCPVKEYTLRIFNRYGQQVFMSVDAMKGWDGTIGGAPAPSGVYMYELWFKGGKKTDVFRKGDITLVR